MTRVTRYKLGYLLVLGLLGSAVAAFLLATGQQIPVMLAVIGVLLIPGRLQRMVFRDFYRARRLLGAGAYAESIEYSERFLRTVGSQPWRKRLIWLSWPQHSADIEALALNNLGAAHLWLGHIAAARAAFDDAMLLDPLYAQPYFNIAVLQFMQGERGEAESSSKQAVKLGYTAGTFKAVMQAAQTLQSRDKTA